MRQEGVPWVCVCGNPRPPRWSACLLLPTHSSFLPAFPAPCLSRTRPPCPALSRRSLTCVSSALYRSLCKVQSKPLSLQPLLSLPLPAPSPDHRARVLEEITCFRRPRSAWAQLSAGAVDTKVPTSREELEEGDG